jgi:tyrosyl-tRNA synthetase
MVLAGGISINRKKIEGIDFQLDDKLLLQHEFILVQRGKKTYYLIQAT